MMEWQVDVIRSRVNKMEIDAGTRPLNIDIGGEGPPAMLLFFDTSTLRHVQHDLSLDDELADREGSFLCCNKCQQRIVDTRFAMSLEGKSIHQRVNPFGIDFRFQCFSQSCGCEVTGTPTHEHTWFTGCRWQYANCSACHSHLGWYFTGAADFFALIIDNLVPCSQSRDVV